MSNLNWCTFCDKAVSAFSNSLYCSEDCLRSDALNHHPLLGYDYAELKDFPRSSPALSSTSSASSVSSVSSPSLSPIPSYSLPSPQGKPTNYSFHRISPPAFDLNPVVPKDTFASSPKRRGVFYL
ncbi:hypothetical protein CLU79DRAFT_779645 [Phycomyces nitens]|nr:hypothetical protein CLU79DRAFT_779645 [Phycomyces nitens]